MHAPAVPSAKCANEYSATVAKRSQCDAAPETENAYLKGGSCALACGHTRTALLQRTRGQTHANATIASACGHQSLRSHSSCKHKTAASNGVPRRARAHARLLCQKPTGHTVRAHAPASVKSPCSRGSRATHRRAPHRPSRPRMTNQSPTAAPPRRARATAGECMHIHHHNRTRNRNLNHSLTSIARARSAASPTASACSNRNLRTRTEGLGSGSQGGLGVSGQGVEPSPTIALLAYQPASIA